MTERSKSTHKSGTLAISGRHVTYFVAGCKDLAEVHKSVPAISQEQFDAIKAGKAAIFGDSNSGLEYRLLGEDVAR